MKWWNMHGGKRAGFTLIELLVVISIIGILSSMLLPSLSRGKEQALAINCVSNLRQLGIGIQLYVDDFEGKFPPMYVRDPTDGITKGVTGALGGFDPKPAFAPFYPPARYRPLHEYVRASRVFECRRDKGQRLLPCGAGVNLKPSNYATVGNSYQYNAGPLTVVSGGGFRRPVADSDTGLASKSEGWVPNPSLYILMHEPPARLYGCGEAEWYQWHYARGISDFGDPQLAPAQFYSPVAFVDGHAGTFNFSRSLQTDPLYPYEPTKDWEWYKPAR